MATNYTGVKKLVHVWGWHLPLDFTEIDIFGAKWSLAFGWVGGQLRGCWGVLDIRIEVHILGLDYIFSTLGISSNSIGQDGQRIRIERQTTCFNEAEHFYMWLLLTVGNEHHISIFVISMPTPRPLRPNRPCACFCQADFYCPWTSTFNMGCIWSPQNLACRGCNQARSYRFVQCSSKERVRDGQRYFPWKVFKSINHSGSAI